MSRDDDALAEDARALLVAYRDEEGLPADVRARVLARVDRSVHATPEPVATVSSSATRWAVLGLAVAAAAAAIWWGRAAVDESSNAAPSAAAYDRDDDRRETPTDDATTARRIEAPTPALPPTPADPPADPPALAPADPPTPARAQPDVRAPARAPTRPKPIEIDDLADETELLRAASSALARKDARHALALLDAGTRRFGTGKLGEERDAMHVLALCELGRTTQARREADAFATAHPSSILLARVRAACAP
jgi:hypothetical protein